MLVFGKLINGRLCLVCGGTVYPLSMFDGSHTAQVLINALKQIKGENK
jgi:hypothetical protein